jgi:hypothetical protein
MSPLRKQGSNVSRGKSHWRDEMKMCLTLGLLLLVGVGCGRESEPGGPGAGRVQAPGAAPADPANTFTIVVPAGKTRVDAGEAYLAVVEINRRKEFREEVAFEIVPPAGVSIDPLRAVVSPAEDELRIRIEPAPDTKPGPAVVQLTAMPASRQNPIHEEFEIEIGAPKG